MKLASFMVFSSSMLAAVACSKSSDAPPRYGTTADTQGNLVLTNAASGPEHAQTGTTPASNPRTSQPAIGGGPLQRRSDAFDVDEGTLSSQPGGRDADKALAAKIRQSLLADRSLSGLARSVDIATSGGTVTLRGLVSTMAERNNIEAKAIEAAGPTRVFNLLVVNSP